MSIKSANIFEKIGTLIPGYKGYNLREEKRNTDKKLRDKLSGIIQQVEIKVIRYQQQLIKNKEINVFQGWEVALKALNTIRTRIKYASYGVSSFFSYNQLKQIELDEIYIIDLEISEKVSLVFNTIETEINEVESVDFVLQHVSEIENILFKRENYMKQFQ